VNDKRKELVEKLEKDTNKKPTSTIGNNAVKKPKPEEEEEEDDFDKEFDMIVKKRKEQEAAKSKII
jgi:tRNA A37 threonylcarbamoyladenosine synthetase subunit TsaC/SUA5/YrdC